jgi:hypothetical protein
MQSSIRAIGYSAIGKSNPSGIDAWQSAFYSWQSFDWRFGRSSVAVNQAVSGVANIVEFFKKITSTLSPVTIFHIEELNPKNPDEIL